MTLLDASINHRGATSARREAYWTDELGGRSRVRRDSGRNPLRSPRSEGITSCLACTASR
jgi:hypothetical protein